MSCDECRECHYEKVCPGNKEGGECNGKYIFTEKTPTKTDKDLKPCPFCQVFPVKEERSSANGYSIPHKKDCLIKSYFPRIQDGTVKKWQKRS